MRTVTVHTHPNIALIKYWGKRDEQLMLPAKSSFSVSLSPLETVTSIHINNSGKDEINISWLWNNEEQASVQPILDYLNFFRKKFALNNYFTINTHNSFPTQAGLASSASGFAAIAMGLNTLCSLNLNKQKLSILARHGSGSACRSIYGGFTLWNKGEKPDGSDSYAKQIFPPDYWPEFRVIIAIVDTGKKPISSRAGMQLTAQTSPLYNHWITESEQRIKQIIHAIKNKDIVQVGELIESDWYGMLSTMLTTNPKIDYRLQATHDIIDIVKNLREKENLHTYFTTDAGPNVKIICLEQDTQIVVSHLKELKSVINIIECSIAQEPTIIETHK
ncbi:MAG: diphosphomevalonate decarboxylase [bacterium]